MPKLQHQHKSTAAPSPFLLVLMVFFSGTVSILFSMSSRVLWTDEIFSAWVTGTGDLSMRETWRIVASGRDAMMPMFYVLGNWWNGLGAPLKGEWFAWQDQALPHAHELWLRIPSLVWVVGGLVSLALVLSRRYGALAVSVGLAALLFGTRPAAIELQWFRGYGMMFGASAMYLALLGSRISLCSPGGWLACASLQVALTMSHPYGIFYVAAPLVAQCIPSAGKSLRHCISALTASVPSALLFLFTLPQLLRFRDMIGEGGQYDPPSLSGLVTALAPINQASFVWPSLLLGTLVVMVLRPPAPSSPSLRLSPVETGVISFAALPFVFWAYSQSDPVFHFRYFIPVSLAVLVTVTAAWQRVAEACATKTTVTWIMVASVCVLQVLSSVDCSGSARNSMAMRGEKDPENLELTPSELWSMPVVVDDLDQFLPRAYYTPGVKYLYPIDDANLSAKGSSSAKRENLVNKLVLAHEKTASETSDRAGISSRHILRRGEWETLLLSGEPIAVISTGKNRMTMDLEKMLLRQGWVSSPGKDPWHRVWRKSPQGQNANP